MAGINAHNSINEKEPFVLKRSEAYIGVLIDDLVNKGTDEPYRMFTSRAEFRMLLRQDNADMRLTKRAHEIGMNDLEERIERVNTKEEKTIEVKKIFQNTSVSPDDLNGYLEKIGSAKLTQKLKLAKVLLRPHVNVKGMREAIPWLNEMLNEYDQEVTDIAEVNIKYESYIHKEQEMVNKMIKLENYQIKESFDYHKVISLSSEAKEKLSKIRPMTIGQASRISGVSPSDISVLLVHVGR